MVKKPKPRRKPITSGVARGRVTYQKLSRIEWGDRALQKRGNAIDHGKMAKTRKVATPENYTTWSKSGHKKYDLEGYDHPREDIKKVPKTYHKYAGSPKVRLSKTTKTAEKVLRNNFTAKERKKIGKVVIEGIAPANKNWIGSNTYYRGSKLSLVKIAPHCADSEDVYTHELIHARRHGGNEYVRDINIDEKQTEFENVGRLSSSDKMDTGYYYYIKDGSFRDNINHDRLLLTGKTGKKRKGKRYMADVRKKYSKSKIQYAHFSPAENLDRYFQVILPNGQKVSVHRRYKPRSRDTKAQILKEFKKEFGKDIRVYEWENGKRVRIGGAVKRGVVSSKTKAPKRVRGVPKKVSIRGKASPKKSSVKRKSPVMRKTRRGKE